MGKMHFQSKIFEDQTAANLLIQEWKDLGFEVVFTNGCFDLLHVGHLDYLAKASELGNKLVVGVNDDASVSRLKGKGRPINDLVSRSSFLAALEMVDLVVPFSEDTPLTLIEILSPDVLVKGGDYKKMDVVGKNHVESIGGEVIIIPFLEGYSSTSIIEKIRS